MTEDAIDRAALRRLLDVIGGDPEDLAELLEDYRTAAPELAAGIAAAAVDGDLERMRIAAHTLKANARDFGALRLSSLCAELERECRAGAVADPHGSAAAIAAEEVTTREALACMSADDLAS